MATLGRNTEPIQVIQPFVSRIRPAISTSRRLGDGLGATLARPAVNANERHVVVGTEGTKGAHILRLVDTDLMIQSMSATTAVVRELPIAKAVLTSQWISSDRYLVATGTSEEGPCNMQIYRLDVNGDCEFRLQENLAVNDAIREVSTNPLRPNWAAYGGCENKVSICDFNTGTNPTSELLTDSGVSSVRWTPFHGSSMISCTTENAQLRMYDVNESKGGPVWTYQGNLGLHKALYTHCQISEYQMLLGYEDNYMEAIDVRKPQESLISNFITGAFDPFCHMIGDMHYHEPSGNLLVTGMADFSVYKHFRSGPEKNTAKLWCHSSVTQNRSKNDMGTVFYGAFLKDNWVVSSFESTLAIYKLD